MKTKLAIALAVVASFLAGYFVHANMCGPFGSAPCERRVLTTDIDLEKAYFFNGNGAPPVKGILRVGSEVEMNWHYSSAAYVSFQTVIPYEQLANHSRVQPRHGANR